MLQNVQRWLIWPTVVAYLSSAGLEETVMFQNMASAIVALSVRNEALSIELDVYVKQKLANFGYRKLTGDWPRTEASTGGWKSHIEGIRECWDDIVRYGYDTNDDVDDRFLYRVRTIHHHLYFVQFQTFLAHLPIWETVFCLAIFVNIHVLPSNYRFYRLMICKRFVIGCLEALVPELKHVQEQLEQIEPVLRTIVTNLQTTVDCRLLIEQMLEKLKTSNIKNKAYYQEKFSNAQGSRDDAEEMVKLFKKVDKPFYESTANELTAPHRQAEAIGKIKSTLPCVAHPQNVCNRMVAESRKQTPPEAIVAIIVAEETFHFDARSSTQALEAIRSCYTVMKQFYSLVKIHHHVSIVVHADPSNRVQFLACTKCSLTAIGEAINQTKNTPNMPDLRVDAALQRMFMVQFKQGSIWHRNTYMHELSLSRLRVDDEQELKLLRRLPQQMQVIGIMLELMLAAVAANIRHSFYRKLYQCATLDSLRALLIYVGESDVLREVENDWYEDVENHYQQAALLMDHLRTTPIGRMESTFADIERSFELQCSILQDLQEMVAIEKRFAYESVRSTCFASGNLSTIKKLLSWKLNAYDPRDTLDRICNTWDANVSELSHIARKCYPLLQLNPVAATTSLGKLQRALTVVDRYDYKLQTAQLVKRLGIDERSLDEPGWEALNQKLAPYYRDILLVKTKWSALKGFCQARKIPLNGALVDQLQKADETHLQTLFDDRCARLRTLLEQCGIRTEDELARSLLTIPSHAISAMEYIQAELCEMLLAVKYFGDNFPALKHSLPLIQGKSYRNYLAHDRLSYDLLTNSGVEKCVINAFVFAHTPVELFADRPPVPSIKLPSVGDAMLWIDRQHELRTAFQSGDVDVIQAKLNEGADITGKYYHHGSRLSDLAELVVRSSQAPHPTVVALLNRYFKTDFQRSYNSQQMASALVRRDFEAAYSKLCAEHELREEFLAWPYLPLEYAEALMRKNGWLCVLKVLFDYGNEPIALEVLKRLDRLFTTPTDRTVSVLNDLLQHAMLRDMIECRDVLLSKLSCCRLLPRTVELAIVVQWSELLNHPAAKAVLEDDNHLDDLLNAAVAVGNDQVVTFFLDRGQCKECYSAAVYFGNVTMLETLLEHYPVQDDDAFLSQLLHIAAVKQRWDCVRLLLEQDAGRADVVYHDSHEQESNVLLLLVQHGRVDLIRCIKRLDPAEFYSKAVNNPFAVASDYDTLSGEMIDAIRSLGFGYLDDPTVLHAAVGTGTRHPLWENVWRELANAPPNRPPVATAHCELLMTVLSRWKVIALLEKLYASETTLSCAVEADKPAEMVGRVLQAARDVRTLDGDGSVLCDIAIGNGGKIVRYGSGECEDTITDGCNAIMSKVAELHDASDAHWRWQDLPLYCGTSVVRCAVLGATQGNPASQQTTQLQISDLTDILRSLRTITDEAFGISRAVYATLPSDSHTLHIFRIDEWCCAYDLHPPESKIDLTSMVNARLPQGRTILYKAIKYSCNLNTIRLLVENGANPLLTDAFNASAISEAIACSDDPAITCYLMKQCRDKSLRNEGGCLLGEVTVEPGRATLLDLAMACDHREAVDILKRL
ncbi:uncharacterized protein LOC118512819 isoform X2 [Anopheles stephensi]|uniref:uncharacterized protein LOC118512819 isoform X2 n=1 Tax=Anopheles stephensi TaxID=30069 RepID=UPI00165874F5|nr:uncharacterized protein LOC118512819 isoform X2 [Anopheles stephensi]